jgi:hypothetical protein
MLRKPTVTKPANPVTTEQYIQNRITQAADKGYTDTKIWIKRSNYDEATAMLDAAGIKFSEIQSDDKSRQLQLSW